MNPKGAYNNKNASVIPKWRKAWIEATGDYYMTSGLVVDYINDMAPMKLHCWCRIASMTETWCRSTSYRIYDAARAKDSCQNLITIKTSWARPPPFFDDESLVTRLPAIGVENGVEQEPKKAIYRPEADENKAIRLRMQIAQILQASMGDYYLTGGAPATGTMGLWEKTGRAPAERLWIDNYSSRISFSAGRFIAEHRWSILQVQCWTKQIHISGIRRLPWRLASNKPAAPTFVCWFLPGQKEKRMAKSPTISLPRLWQIHKNPRLHSAREDP